MFERLYVGKLNHPESAKNIVGINYSVLCATVENGGSQSVFMPPTSMAIGEREWRQCSARPDLLAVALGVVGADLHPASVLVHAAVRVHQRHRSARGADRQNNVTL